MNILRVGLLVLLLSPLGACGEADSAPVADATPSKPQVTSGPGGTVVYAGAIDHEIEDLSWSLIEHVSAAGRDLSGFDMMLYGKAEGRFKNVLSFTAIPWEVPLNEQLPVGGRAGDGVVGAQFVEDAFDRDGTQWLPRAGSLTITEYSENLSGGFEVTFSDSTKQQTITARGTFSDIPAIHPR